MRGSINNQEIGNTINILHNTFANYSFYIPIIWLAIFASKRRSENERPLAIILNTKKGQGVEYIENLKNSHHLRLTDEVKAEIEKAVAELEGRWNNV